MLFTEEHEAIRRTIARIVKEEINPHVDEWEKAGRYPAHQVMKILGKAGLLGITRPPSFGGPAGLATADGMGRDGTGRDGGRRRRHLFPVRSP